MQKAVQPQQGQDKKLFEIAKSVGYESDTAFSKALKGVLGSTPGDYRRGSPTQLLNADSFKVAQTRRLWAVCTSGTLLGKAVYPWIFHQDPRYFDKGKGSIKSRALYAISRTVIARGDNGRWEPNYSNILGHFSAAAISNLYYPDSDRGSSLTVGNSLAGIGALCSPAS